MKPVYVFDLDGTLCNIEHRLHYIQGESKDWREFFAACVDDKPIQHMLQLASELSFHAQIVYVSGRSDEVRGQTLDWLEAEAAPEGPLYMRKAGDHKPDHELKIELL